MGLVSFWLSDEYTWGATECYDFKNKHITRDEQIQEWAQLSRESVLNHDKFKLIFADYAAAIGIDKVQNVSAWESLSIKLAESKIKIAKE